MVIQIDAIDTVHILVADILAHAREDSPSQVMVFNVHDIAIRILIYGISQGALALQHHREDGFLVDDSHIEGLIRSAVGIGLHDFIDKFLQCHIHSHAVWQFTSQSARHGVTILDLLVQKCENPLYSLADTFFLLE